MDLGIPAILYVLQNNLNFFALKVLSPTLFVVCGQTKILSTAVFGAALAGKKYGNGQMFALAALTVGVVFVQTSEKAPSGAENNSVANDVVFGLFAVLLAAAFSGLSGVYLEILYKKEKETIWLRNVQLGVFSVPAALVNLYFDTELFIVPESIFRGFDFYVLVLVSLHAIGGLVVAFVLLRSSAVAKCFAASTSLSLCALISSYLNQHPLNPLCVACILLVCTSTALYSMNG